MFLGLMPKDADKVKPNPFFSCLALDSFMEFLFGESSATLLLTTNSNAAAILDAYIYRQMNVGRRMQMLQKSHLT